MIKGLRILLGQAENGKRPNAFMSADKLTERVKDEKLPSKLGSGLRGPKKTFPEICRRFKKAGIHIYQQPAGFEDVIISKWK